MPVPLMYRKCTVDLAPKSGFRLPEAKVVNGEKKEGVSKKKPPASLKIIRGFKIGCGGQI